jgi:hypothetical protein
MQHTYSAYRNSTMKYNFEDTADPWAKSALVWMKSRPNHDGTFGINAVPLHADAWISYFKSRGMSGKVNYLASCLSQKRAYVVPCADPTMFDPSYIPHRDLGEDATPPRQNSEWWRD